MSQIVTAVFDGQVLRPDTPLNMQLGKRYVITISTESESTEDAWDVLKAFTGTVEAPLDWSIEHDHYLYGTPIAQRGVAIE
ncbi:MAG: antitoxin family protein [Hormoscilla sp. GUM202]|nr:antitoxin family protein [Hormoscilla sp. GM7CHS1pb]MBO1349259.1 antitoxin family protein [Hormoscilla sp. GUM202]